MLARDPKPSTSEDLPVSFSTDPLPRPATWVRDSIAPGMEEEMEEEDSTATAEEVTDVMEVTDATDLLDIKAYFRREFFIYNF